MISTEIRRSQTYVGTGDVNSYTFPFRVFAAGQVKVYVRAAGAASGTLLDTTQYSVTLASASAQSVGGTVTLSSPLAAGAKLVILSNIPYTQLLALQNQGAFNAEDLNGAWDKNTALIQQVLDTLNRAVLAPELGDDTPEAFTLSLFEARDTAVEKAGEAANSASASAASASDAAASATAAASSAAEAEASKDAINVIKEQVTAEGQKQIAAIQAEGGTQISNVQSVGQAQTSHISTAGSDVVASIKLYGQDEVDRITQTGGTWNDTVVATGQKWKQDVISAGSDSLAKAAASAAAAKASEDKAAEYANQASSGQIQADWAETDTASKGYIKNKPTQLTSEAVSTGTATEQGTISAAQLNAAIKAVAPAERAVNLAELQAGTAASFGTVTAAGIKGAIEKWAPTFVDLSGLLPKVDFTWANLGGKPAIPAAQVNSDWNAASGKAQILNKPALGALASKDQVESADIADGAIPADTTAAAILAAFTQFATENGIT